MAAFSLEEFESAKSSFTDGQKIAPEAQQNQFKTWIRKCDAELAAGSSLFHFWFRF
jgi:hypothetical protein